MIRTQILNNARTQAAGLFLAVILFGGTEAAQKQKPVEIAKPNIIHFILDDWGYYELSSMGSKELKTPYIDKLAQEGMRFTQALAGGSYCAPTRASLMTGFHLGHSIIKDNKPEQTLRTTDVTIPMILKQAGYVTGGFGKWGIGDVGTHSSPDKKGFDYFYGYYHQIHAHTYFPEYLIRNGVKETLPGNQKLAGEEKNAYGNYFKGQTFSHDLIFAETKKWLSANKNKSFYLYAPWTLPHGLFGITDDHPFWLKYKDKPWTAGNQRDTDARVYAAMVEMFDAHIGEIIDSLKHWGVEQNTMVLITGDNGAHARFPSNKSGEQKSWPGGFFRPNHDPKSNDFFRGRKGELTEGGLRVPTITWWPGKIKPGQVSDMLCYFPDYLPTFAEIAGITPPEKIDGISILPTLIGEQAAGRPQKQHEYLFWLNGTEQAVRMGNWKLIISGNNSASLYDLSKDISESNNVAGANSGIVSKMRAYAKEANEPL